MNKEALETLYGLAQRDGYTKSLEEFTILMQQNPEAVNQMYGIARKNGYQKSEEDFNILVGFQQPVKKKEPTPESPESPEVDSDGSGDLEITEEVITENEGVGTSDYLQSQDLDFEMAEVKPYSPVYADAQMQDLSVGERDTAIERIFGKNEFTDFFGDMWRSGVQGQAQGGTIDESLELLGKSRIGADITSEDIQDFLIAQRQLQSVGVSDEMKDFNRIYQANGGGAWGWVKGVLANPSTIPQLFVSSMSAMVNPTVLAGAAAGAAAGSVASPIGTAAGFFAGAGITLETGLTFAELLQKEVVDRGLKMDEAGVRQVLEDKDAMSSIRNKSAGRGLVIGAIDGIASKVGVKVGARTLGGKAYGLGKKVKATGQVAAIEAAGGSLGEIGGRLAADQEMDAAEVLFEGFAGTATLPATLGIAAYKSPKYYINKSQFNEEGKDLTRVDPEVMEDLIYNSTDEEFAAAEITIKNNPELEKVAAERKKKIHSKAEAQREILQAKPNISQEILDKLVPLQEELNSLEGNKSQPAKKRKAEIIAEMNKIEETMVVERFVETKDLAEKKKKDTEETTAVEEVVEETTATPEVKEEAKDLAEAVALDTDETVTNEEGEVVGEKVDEGEVMIRYGEESEQDLFAPLDFKNTKRTGKGPAPANLTFFGPANRAGTYKAEGTRNKFTAKLNIKNPFEVKKSDVWTVEKLQPIIDAGHDAIVVTDPVAPETIVLDKSIIELTAPTVEKINQVGDIFSDSKNTMQENETKIAEISDIESINTDNSNVNQGQVSVSGSFSPGFTTIVGDSKLNQDRRNAVTKAVKVDKQGKLINKDVNLYFDIYDLKDGSKVFSLVNPNHRDSAKRSAVYSVNITYDANSPIAQNFTTADQNAINEVLIKKMNQITSEVTGVKTKPKQDATTKQSPTKVDGQKQAKPVQDVSKRDTKRGKPTREKVQDQNEKQKQDTQKKTKIKKLNAIAPNAYVNVSDTGSTKVAQQFIKPAKRALSALKKLAPDVMVVIHEKDVDYRKAIGNPKQKSAGVFRNDNVIHINAELANTFKNPVRVLQHEIFHAILKNKLGSETKIAALTDRMFKALSKSELDPEVKKQIDEYIELYKDANKSDKERLSYANEEYMAEVFGFLANNLTTLKAPQQSIIKRFLSKLSNLLGLTAEDVLGTDKAMIDLLNVVAGKVQTGETITKSDVKQLDLFAGGKEVKNPSAALKTMIYGDFEITYTEDEKIADYIKEGLITQPKKVKDVFKNMGDKVEVLVHSPDDMLAGEIKYKGEQIFEGSGGIFFVTKFGDVWASTKDAANQIVKGLNKQIDEQGRGFMMLAKGSTQKLFSAAAGVEGAMKILDLMLDNKIFSPSEFRAAVSRAVAKEQTRLTTKAKKEKKPAPKFKPFKLRKSAKDLKKDVVKLLADKDSGTFEARGNIVRGIADALAAAKLTPEQQLRAAEFLGGDTKRKVGVGSTVQAKTGIPLQQGLADLVALAMAENITKGLSTGDIYGIIEVNKKVQTFDTNHPSYQKTIKIVDKDGKPIEGKEGKPILHLPQDREAGKDVLVPNFGQAGTTPYKPGQVPTMTGEVNMVTEKTSLYTGKSQEKRIFNKEDSINDVVAKARGLDYSEAAIFEYLRNNRKLSTDEARAALEQKTEAFTDIPMEFQMVNGGINEGQTLFNQVSYEMNKFSVDNPDATRIQTEKKAFEILRNNDIFKAQDKNIQNNIEIAFKGVVGKIESVEVNRRISRLKRDLYISKRGQRDLRKVQLQLKQLIRKYVPKEATFTKPELDRILNSIATATQDSILSVGQKIFDAVDAKRKQIKFKRIKEIKEMVNKLAKSANKKSSRPIASNIEGAGVAFFKEVRNVLQASLIPDAVKRGEKLFQIGALIESNQQETQIALEKQKRGEALTLREQTLLARILAFDTFQNIYNQDLEAITDILEKMKEAKTDSIAMLNMARLERAEVNNEIYESATNQIRQNYPELFLDDGKGDLKTKRDLDAVDKERFLGTTRSKIKNFIKQFNFTSTVGIRAYLRNRLSHLGTLMNIIDDVNVGNTFFYDSVYQGINRMHTKALRGYYNAQTMIDSIAASIDGINSYQDLKEKLPFGPQKIDFKGTTYINAATNEAQEEFSVTQLMRIYALSKNKIQAEKLEASGFGEAQIKQVKQIIGTDAIEFVDKIVEWLSTDYFNSINNVYKQANYTDLGFVENYFPTKSISQSDVSKDLIGGANFAKVFSAETAPSLKERVDEKGAIDTEPDFIETLENHVSQMERYKAYALGVKNLQALFKVPAVNTLLTRLGISERVNTSINLALNPESGVRTQGFMAKLQRKFTGFALGFKAIQLLKQSTSFINAFEEYKGKGGLGGFMIGMAKVVARLPYYMKLASEISPDFRDRLRKGLEGDLYRLETGSRTTAPVERRIKDMRQALKEKDYDAFKNKIITLFQKGAAMPTVLGDIMGVMGYMVNYEANLANGMSKAKAAEAFNNYNATQQSRRETDKIPLQQSQNELTRAFTMFGSTLFLQMNKVMSSTGNIAKAIKNKKVPRKQDIRGFALNFAAANVMFALAANMFKFMGNDEDKEEAMNRLKDAMYGLNLLYQIPFIGAASQEFIMRQQGRSIGYADDVVNPIKSVIRKINKGIKDGRVDKSIRPLVEILLGAQLDPFVGMYNFINDQGGARDDAFYDIFGISPSYRPGTGVVYSPEDLKYIKETNPELYKQIQENKKLSKSGGKKKMSKSEMKRTNPEMYYQIYGE